MPDRLRGRVAVPAVLLATISVEAIALRAHTLGVLMIAFVSGAAIVVLVLQASIENIALAAAYACAFTLTWNGWFVGPLRPGDVLILITLMLLAVANPNSAFRMPPWWVKQLALVIAALALITIFFPPNPVYLSHRIVLDAVGQPIVDTKTSIAAANLGTAFKFIVAVFATPVAFVGASRIDPRAARRLGVAFAAGAALSGWAATLDHLGTDFGRIITRIPDGGSRQLGFANHPNFLAAGTVLAVPFAFWLLFSTNRRERLLGMACLPGLLGGVYASGSRGGAVCAVLVLGACVLLHSRTRIHSATIALGAAVLLLFAGGLFPSLGHAILKATRLAGGATTSGSDTVRSLVGHQGVLDFRHSPIHGIGLQASFDASQVYLQELASGGLILFVAMQVYMGGAIFTAWGYLKRNDMAVAVVGSLAAVLALNWFEADLTDRFYYVPAAILLAMVHANTIEDEQGQTDRGEHLVRRTTDGLAPWHRHATQLRGAP